MLTSEKKLLIIGVLLAVAVLMIILLSGTVFLPVLIALILTYILNPLVSLLERWGIKRIAAIIIVFFLLVIVATLGGFFFFNSIKSEFSSVQINLPEYADRVYAYIPAEVKSYLGIETPEKAYQHLTDALNRLRNASSSLFKETFAFVTRAFSSTLAFILSILGYFITPVYLYYFLADTPEIKSSIMSLIPERHRQKVRGKALEVDEVLTGFVRGQLMLCGILSFLYSIGLYFIGIDLAILIGVVSGVLFMVPYLGTILGIVLSVLMAFLKFHDVLHPLLCLGWFMLVQSAEGAIITPKIVGDKVGLHPVVTIVALLLAGQWFGIFGMLLAVPATAVLNVFFRSLMEYYRNTPYYKGA